MTWPGAAGGHASVLVARQPVVAIIPTGDEIRPLGSTARPGEILDTNSLMIAARCRQLSAEPLLSEVQPDDPDTLAAEIRRCAQDADLVLVIAGSSRGRGDHAAAVLAQVGGVAVTGVAVRPGHPALLGHAKHPGSAARPAASGRAGIAPVIGLPGYPLASTGDLRAVRGAAAGRPPGRPARGQARPAGRARPGLVVPARHRGLGAGDARPGGRVARRAGAAGRHSGQARGRVDQPARPGRRLVADPGRPDRLPWPAPPRLEVLPIAPELRPLWPSRNGGEPRLAVLVAAPVRAARHRGDHPMESAPVCAGTRSRRFRCQPVPQAVTVARAHAYRSQSLAFAARFRTCRPSVSVDRQ